jgi:hypothetical protein
MSTWSGGRTLKGSEAQESIGRAVGFTASGHRNGLDPGSKTLKPHSDHACSGGSANGTAVPRRNLSADSAAVVDGKKVVGHREVPRLRTREKL